MTFFDDMKAYTEEIARHQTELNNLAELQVQILLCTIGWRHANRIHRVIYFEQPWTQDTDGSLWIASAHFDETLWRPVQGTNHYRVTWCDELGIVAGFGTDTLYLLRPENFTPWGEHSNTPAPTT